MFALAHAKLEFMSSPVEQNLRPLHRGGNAVFGVVLLLAIFLLAGPPIGGIAALGPVGFFAIPLAYSIGLLPALLTGMAFSGLWLCKVGAAPRLALVTLVGILSSILLIHTPNSATLFAAWAGGVAALVCALLANVVIGRTEMDRSAHIEVASSSD